jgi:hypothetical protein
MGSGNGPHLKIRDLIWMITAAAIVCCVATEFIAPFFAREHEVGMCVRVDDWLPDNYDASVPGRCETKE